MVGFRSIFAFWAGAVAPSPATGYTATPAGGTVAPGGTDVFTFTPNGTSTATVTPTPTAGSFSPATVTFDGTEAAKTAMYTAPSTPQTVDVSYANDGSLADPGDTTLNVGGGLFIDFGVDLGPNVEVGPMGVRFEV